MPAPPADPYGDLIPARLEALERVFGKHGEYLVSPLPFYLGGGPTLVGFPDAVPGAMVYCTSDLTGGWGSGQQPGLHGEYEFVMVVERAGPLAPFKKSDGSTVVGQVGSLLTDLAKLSLTTRFLPGETAGPLHPSLRPLTQALFVDLTKPRRPFEIKRKTYGLTLVMLITDTEFKFAKSNGHAEVVRRLRERALFPISSLSRLSVA